MGRFVCAALVAAVCASTASANAGPPWIGGRVLFEPVLKGAKITRETLVLDLRPVARGEFAHVEATYHFTTIGFGGTLREIELTFVTGVNDIDTFVVTCDGKPVATRVLDGGAIFDGWKPPSHTPGIGGAPLSYGPRLSQTHKFVAFTLSVAAGEHELNVKYRAPATKNLTGYPVAYQQFAYILAPAKAWEAFGKLDVTVHVPEGWAAASEPALTRTGDTLRGSFDGIPADALALTLQAPIGRAYGVTQAVLWVVFALLCVATVWCVWRVGCKEGRRDDIVRIFVIGGAVAIAAHFIVSAGLICTFIGIERALPAHQDGGTTPDAMAGIMFAVLFSVVIVPAFAAFAVGTGLVVRHLNRPVPPASTGV